MRFQSLVMPWLWPNAVRVESTFASRLGRVLHWSFVFFAAISAIGGVTASVVELRAHQLSLTAINDWKKSHKSEGITVDELIQQYRQNAPPQPEPVEIPTAPEYSIVGLVVGFFLFFIGRAIRYVLAAE